MRPTANDINGVALMRPMANDINGVALMRPMANDFNAVAVRATRQRTVSLSAAEGQRPLSAWLPVFQKQHLPRGLRRPSPLRRRAPTLSLYAAEGQRPLSAVTH